MCSVTMRAKPISVKFPVPKIAAAKLRDLAISRDPRLLELGILAVQITEHEKIVVSFGKPLCGQVKPKSKTREAPKKKTRVKTVRNRPKNATPVSRPVTGHSISIPGLAAPLQNRNPVCHLNNNRVITNNTKGERQAPKDKLRQAVYRRQDYPSTLTTLQSSPAITTAASSAFVSIDRTTARNTSLSCSNIKVLSNSPPTRATEHRALDNKNHNVFQNGSRSRAESETVARTPTHISPSASPSNESTLSSSSTPPLGETQNRSRSSSASSPEQASLSLVGLQETTKMGRQRAMFNWFMNSEEKKFCASNRLRELAKGHGADDTPAITSPGIAAPRQTTTSTTSPSLHGGTFAPSTTNTTPVISPAGCATTSTRTIPAPTPGIHRVKIPNRYSHDITQSVQVLNAPFSVGGGLSGSETHFTTGQQERLTSPSNIASDNKVTSGRLDGSIVEVSNLMSSCSGQLFPTTSSSSEKFWTLANQVNCGVVSDSVINTVPAGEVKNDKTEPYDSSFVGTNNKKSACKVSHDTVECCSSTMHNRGEVSSNITRQADVLCVVSKSPQVIKPGETKEPLKYCVGPSVGYVNIENTQYLAMLTVDANNNQTDVSKLPNVPLMYPYSTGMLSTPVAVGSGITASPGATVGPQYAIKPQATTIQQACTPDQFAFAAQMALKLESTPDMQTASYGVKTVTSQIASGPPFVVQPQVANNSPVTTTWQPATMQPVNIHHTAGPYAARDTSQATTSPWDVTNYLIPAVSHCVTRAQVTTQSSSSSQIATAPTFASTQQFLINPQNAASFQAFTSSQVFASPQVTGNLQISANQQVAPSSTATAAQVGNKLQAVASADFTPSPPVLVNCQTSCPSQTVSSPQTTASSTVVQNSKLLLAARENIQRQSGQQLDSVMRTVKTEDYSQSLQDAGEVLSDETNKSHENQSLTAAPIQFIDLSGTLRYWQQWSLYYRNLIERQNAVAALLSMQNAVPPATAATTLEDVQPNLQPGSEASSGVSPYLSYSPGKEDQLLLQKSSGRSSENQSALNIQQDEKRTELLSGHVFTAAKIQQSSKGQETASLGTMYDATEQFISNTDCVMEKEFVNTEINNTAQSLAEEICNNIDLSAEATVISSRRKSVIVDSRTNELGSPISDRSDLKDSICEEPRQLAEQSDNGMPENSDTKTETLAIAFGSAGDEPEDETSKDIPELENSGMSLQKTEIMLKTECVLDVDVCDRETPSPSIHDSSDDSSGLVPVTRRLRSRRSNSNPLAPELSFIPESAIECVNVGGNKRGSSNTEPAPPAKRRRSKRSS